MLALIPLAVTDPPSLPSASPSTHPDASFRLANKESSVLALGGRSSRLANAILSVMSGKERASIAADDDEATQATTEESRWRADVNRQAQPHAQQHQLAASQAAAAKRKAEAMPQAERKRRAAEHKKEVRAREAAERAAAVAAAIAAAAAARVPDLAALNMWLEEMDEELCDEGEWDEFNSFICDLHCVSELGELDAEDLEQNYFAATFLEEWRESDAYEEYQMSLSYDAMYGSEGLVRMAPRTEPQSE